MQRRKFFNVLRGDEWPVASLLLRFRFAHYGSSPLRVKRSSFERKQIVVRSGKEIKTA